MATDAQQRIQKAAQEFLARVSKMERPKDGSVADFMHDMPGKGLNACLRAAAECIGNSEDIAMQTASKDLLTRLRDLCEKNPRDASGHINDHPYNPTDALLAVAYPGEDGNLTVAIQNLREAFTHKGRPVLDELSRMFTDVAVNKNMELDDNVRDQGGKPKGTGDAPKGWRESLRDEGKPVADDKAIRDSAKEFDKEKPPVNDNDIKKSAAGGNDFVMGDEHRTEYERTEGAGGLEYLAGLQGETRDIRRYAALTKQIQAAFDETLGKCLLPAGVAPGKSA